MKCKIFHGDGWAAVEKEVNDWLAGQLPQPNVRVSETKMHVVQAKKAAIATVTLWYD